MSFNFGAKTAAPPAFGAATSSFGQAPSQPTFGAPTGGLQFGATPNQPTNQSTGLFGTSNPSAPSTGFSFGTSAPAAAPSFGSSTALAAPAFGTPAVPSASAFGAAPVSTAPTFGQPATTATTGLFGAPAATSVPSTGLFGAPAASAPSTGFSFGTSTSLPTASVAPTLQTSNPAGLSFGTPASTAAPAAGLTLGFTAASIAGPTTGLSFGAPAAAATTSGFSFGTSSAGITNTTSTAGFTLGGLGGTAITTTTNATPTNVGLGGIATSQSKTGTKVSTQKEVAPKEQTLPNEILQTVEQFKEVVKQQKVHSSDISRCSVRDYRKVEQEIDLLNNLLAEVETQLQKNRQMTEKLKYDTAKGLQNVEMAQRTQDTPPGLQYENSAPLKFFLDLADNFEREMMAVKVQIESADKYVKNCNNPHQITHQDIAMGMKKLHETFVALAGQLQAVHSQVETQKETYINLRKQLFSDHSNPFDKTVISSLFNDKLKKSLMHSPPKVATGPTPFSNVSLGGNGINALNALTSAQAMPSFSGNVPAGTTGFGTQPFPPQPYGGTQPSNTSLFGTTSLNQTAFNFNSSSGTFQLQKPPTGNKRAH